MVTRRYVGQSGRVYEPIEQIGPVGFGAVERVRDGDGNEYALKTLHLGFDPDVLAVEAENLSRVQHETGRPSASSGTSTMAPIPSLSWSWSSQPAGRSRTTSARRSRRGSFPVETITEWARQLLQGLVAIHEVLLHRDLKPGNVLLEGDVLKIADFGMTRLVEASTRTETLKGGGTPLYMPPEGWAVQTGRPRRRPMTSIRSGSSCTSSRRYSPRSVATARSSAVPIATTPRSPRELRDDLPPALERLILQLLRKTPPSAVPRVRSA